MVEIENIKQKATFLNELCNNEDALFEYINTNQDNLEEVIQQYKPERFFRPVKALRFLIANELKKGTVVNKTVIEQLKQAIENRDVSSFYDLNDSVKQSLASYKESKTGMFPNWGHTFKVLFPFIHSISNNEEVKTLLDQLANQIVEANKLQNIRKHPVSFQGSQNYGSDHVWVAIIPKASPNVQSAYQIFFSIDYNGIRGGIHKGHKLEKGIYSYDDDFFSTWEAFLENTKSWIDEWELLNSRLDFSSFKQSKYYLVGAYWEDDTPQDQTDRFIKDSIWVNGYTNKFINYVNKVPVNSHVAIKTVDRKGNKMFIKAIGIVVSNLNDGQNLDVKWDEDFKEFKVGFSGGYWDTIKEVKKTEHINAIWRNIGIMENVKQEFINWLINKPKSKYFNNDKEILNRYLDSYNTYFETDIFEVSGSNYKSIIDTINKVAYQDETSEFFKYSNGESNHRPRAILGKTNYYQFLEEKFIKRVDNSNNTLIYKAPLNQIYYGPPGTGKTYSTILETAKIITQDATVSYDEAQTVFNENLGGRIEFITFHQNYSYEDFIQGLRPDIELAGELSFFKSDGVFKRIADRALKNLTNSEDPESAKKEFYQVFYELINPLNEGEVDELEIKMKQTSFYITEVGEKSIEFRKNQGDSKHTLSINTLKKMYDQGANDIILGGLQPYYNPILSLLLGRGKADVMHVEQQNYVIIIDEINRANISRVFGELITLIEKDKRSHGSLPITATLPSGEKFIVPSNLYIIGTMNTADKSIALLDIALRRRFEFVPMYPKTEIMHNGNNIVNNSKTLQKINNEIISRKGHDFTIGHSYFMDEDYELKNTVDNKVIPLLLEYFMNDFEEVRKILKAAELEVEGWPMKLVTID